MTGEYWLIASTRSEALAVIKERGIAVNKLRFVQYRQDLLRVQGTGHVMHVTRCGAERPDYYELYHIVRNRGFTMHGTLGSYDV